MDMKYDKLLRILSYSIFSFVDNNNNLIKKPVSMENPIRRVKAELE
jgi:hypothetical protein